VTIERAYRRVLAWFPRRWRDENGEALVATALDAAEAEGRTTPSFGELASFVALAARLRVSAMTFEVPTTVRDRASSISVGTGLTLVLASVAFGGLHLPTAVAANAASATSPTFGPFSSPAVLLYGVWALAFATTIAGLPRFSRSLLLITIPVSGAVTVWSNAAGFASSPSSTLLLLLGMLAAVGATGNPVRGRWARTWLLTAVVATAAGIARSVALLPALDRPRALAQFESRFFSEPSFALWTLVGLSVATVCAVAFRQREWAGAFLLSALPWAAYATFRDDRFGEIITAGAVGLTILIISISPLLRGTAGERDRVMRARFSSRQ